MGEPQGVKLRIVSAFDQRLQPCCVIAREMAVAGKALWVKGEVDVSLRRRKVRNPVGQIPLQSLAGRADCYIDRHRAASSQLATVRTTE